MSGDVALSNKLNIRVSFILDHPAVRREVIVKIKTVKIHVSFASPV